MKNRKKQIAVITARISTMEFQYRKVSPIIYAILSILINLHPVRLWQSK